MISRRGFFGRLFAVGAGAAIAQSGAAALLPRITAPVTGATSLGGIPTMLDFARSNRLYPSTLHLMMERNALLDDLAWQMDPPYGGDGGDYVYRPRTALPAVAFVDHRTHGQPTTFREWSRSQN